MSADMRAAEAINEIEGFLLWEAEKEKARVRARAFCARLPWLTESQRAEVEGRYADDQLVTSKAFLESVAERSGELRAEYEGVYRALRRRLVAACLLGSAALPTAVAFMVR